MSYGSNWGGSPWGGDTQNSVVEPVVYDVQLSDTISITDSVSVARTPALIDVFLSDTISITDSVSTNVAPSLYNVLVSDAITITDSVLVAVAPAIFDAQANDTISITDSLSLTVVPAFYDVLVSDAISTTDTAFLNIHQIPSIIVAAQSPTKVEVVFSVAMVVDANFLNAANYTITQVEGSIQVPVLSVVASGPLPTQRATLEIGTPLESKRYYFLHVASSIISVLGDSTVPNYARFQWKDQTTPIFRAPLEIPISDFSGEVQSGILGQPDGLVFFSPAYEDVASTSTIEVEQLSACTLAYDSYEMPNPPDPVPLLTWGPGIGSVIGPTSVLWAPYDRLGLPRMDLQYDVKEDPFAHAYDLNLSAVLVETIDITKGGFLNDSRWKTFPGTGATVFRTAANLSPIGPGPTTSVNLDWPKISLNDSFPMTDQVILNTLVRDMQDNVGVTENLSVQKL